MNSKFDIIPSVVILVGIMLFFPLIEWSQWHPGYVLVYALWLLSVYFLGRLVLGPLIGRKNYLPVAGAVLLIVAATFLMCLSPVDFPRDMDASLQPHVRAMWVTLLAALGLSVPCGIWETRQVPAPVQEPMRPARTTDVFGAGDASFAVKSGYKTIHIPLASIIYIESRNNYACFHLDDAQDVVSQISLKAVMELLPEGKFIRIHKSYIVPAWRIERSSAKEVFLSCLDGSLPVGRAHAKELKNNV